MAASTRSLVLLLLAALTLHVAEGALTIVNQLTTSGIFIQHPPGCCSPFGFARPPPGYECARSPLVLVDQGESLTLNKLVGPYPIAQMILQLPYGKYVCVGGPSFTEFATLTIQPSTCSVDGSAGTPTSVSAAGDAAVTPLCQSACWKRALRSLNYNLQWRGYVRECIQCCCRSHWKETCHS